ncbi:hypothetical protein GCM10022243_20200 [Saccharothrix violaceirubra]|uniref:Nucleotide-binding universal stress UspA family protein n=1 Tax=Saccharothrix violaceirubra TaxID=413306 RepID=A0A7W7T210_9PSEU|nr:universal stress protein [Saccharothrix violaceirubra]MBB4965076.1 nucleotide-binding universal stress UspA family protein [Saccharothrix violaceirubra]
MGKRPVVVGVDGTVAGVRALAWAMDQALERDVPLHVVNAWQQNTVPARERSRELVDDALVTAATGRLRHPQIIRRCLPGPAAEVLVEAARSATLLVLAAHDRPTTGLGRVSAHCVLHASVPVVVLHEETAD